MAGLGDLSLTQAADMVASGKTTSIELLRACWTNIDAANSQVNAVIWQEREAAEAAAHAADQAVRDRRPLGLLHGVPMAHKDMYYQAGKLSTCGSALRKDFRPTATATVIARMAAAGAYTFGGLNMAEFAQNPTGHNKTFGDCHNPWNLPYITGGSSSGSGASVAARFTYMALGSDTGGSIRLPASACGVTGLKPTQTRVSRFGVMPLSFSHDNVGPLARTARDCARVLRVIAGHDPRDPTSAREDVPDYEALMHGDLRGLRIGVPTNYFVDGADESVLAAMDAALAVLAERGGDRQPLCAAFARRDRGVWRHRLPRRGRTDPCRMDAPGSRGVWQAYQRADVSWLCHSGGLLHRGAQPPRADPEGLRGGGVCPGRCAGHAHYPHVPADIGGDRYRSWSTGHRAPVHGGLGEHAAVQLPWAAGDQCSLRFRSKRLPDRAADRGAAVCRRACSERCRCLSTRYGLASGTPRHSFSHCRRCRMSKPKVAFIGTGGTIASLGRGPLDIQDYSSAGVVMHADEILARWPETALVADVMAVRYRNIISPAIGFPEWQELVALCQQLVEDHPDLAGIVIGHGTATLEETAYFLNLTVKVSIPVVVVGAQRPSSALSSDAGMNLVSAIRVAASPDARDMGVLVVLNDEIHSAREVTKTSTSRLQTFRTPDFGVLGHADGDAIAFYRRPIRRHAPDTEFDATNVAALPRVDIAYSYAGGDGVATRAFVAAHARGIIAAGFAPGFCTPGEIDALTEAAEKGVLVVQCTRAGSGRTFRGNKLRQAGFLIADNLTPQKARILLALALTVTSDPEAIMAMFRTY